MVKVKEKEKKDRKSKKKRAETIKELFYTDSGTPKKGELVIIKVNKIMPYGAFVSLEEYPNYEGFLHIREVASKWIKNIGDYIKVNMTTVGKVLNVEEDKKIAEISLRAVGEDTKRKRMEEYQNEKKALKIIEIAYKKAKAKPTKSMAEKIKKDYEMVYDLLEDIKEKEVSPEHYFPKKVAKIIEEIVESLIKRRKLELKAIAHITTTEENGIEIIRNALKKIKEGEVSYLGAPKYLIRVEGEEFKEISKKIKKIENQLSKELGKSLVEFEVKRGNKE